MLPYGVIFGVNNVGLQIEGTLIAQTTNFSAWPNAPGTNSALDFLSFAASTDITLSGSGLIDGDGYSWWWYVLVGNPDNRPNLLQVTSVAGVTVTGALRMVNSPEYHVYMSDVADVLIEGLDIRVDVTAQQAMLDRAGKLTRSRLMDSALRVAKAQGPHAAAQLLQRGSAAIASRLASLEALDQEDAEEAMHAAAEAGLLPSGLPTFPLNTDGIDIAGNNVTVRRVFVENFDDALCVKPLHAGSGIVAGPCAQDYLWEDSVVSLGVGLTIGSVPPNAGVACVKNVTYRNITSITPIKGIYIKPNPGTSGSGIIDSVTYEDVHMTGALWWSIYVGLQQQEQPGGGANTGCSFFYPLPGTTCPTQPLVPVTNLRLINVTSEDSLLSPGLLRCANVTGTPYTPCTGWEFANTTWTSLTNWPVGPGFLCEGVKGGAWPNTSPAPQCS